MQSVMILSAAAMAMAAPAALVAKDQPQGFTLIASDSATPIQHLPITANGGRLWIGKDTAAFCPSDATKSCPSLTTDTTVLNTLGAAKDGGASLNVVVPGGQRLFVEASGLLGFTEAHSGVVPAGAYTEGFQYTPADGSNNAFGSFTFNGQGSKGLLACGASSACNVKTGEGCAPWSIYAALPHVNEQSCLSFDALTLASDKAAWEYE